MGPVRLPLQTGASVVGRPVVYALVYFVVCGAVTGLLFGRDSGPGVMLLTAVGGPLLFLPLFLDWRASDLIADSEGMRVRGGPFSAVHVAWSDVDAATCRFYRERAPALKSNVGSIHCYALTVGKRDGNESTIARATEGALDEVASLRTVLDIIVTLAWPPATETSLSLPADVLTCGACGAPASPVETATTRCAFCEAEIPVPEALRKRVTDARELSSNAKRLRKLAARVLAQPSATGVNVRLALLTGGYLAAAFAASVAAFQFGRGDIALIASGAFIGSFASVRAYVADRVALRSLTTEYGARAPLRAGAPARCRCCTAPLPEPAAAAVVVGCVYCRAENVLGIDLRSDLVSARSNELELSRALSNRILVHKRRAIAVAFALILCSIGAALLLVHSAGA